MCGMKYRNDLIGIALVWNEISNNMKQVNSKEIFRTKLKEDADKLRNLDFSRGTVCIRNRRADFVYY